MVVAPAFTVVGGALAHVVGDHGCDLKGFSRTRTTVVSTIPEQEKNTLKLQETSVSSSGLFFPSKASLNAKDPTIVGGI